jgi:hypothetical protein
LNPSDLPHVHLLLNHWPVIGTFIGLGLCLLAIVMKSNDLKHATFALFAVLALVSIPTYLSGNAAEQAIRDLALSEELIESHEGAALLAFLASGLTGLFGVAGLWQFSRNRKASAPAHVPGWVTSAVLISALLTTGLMAVAGNTGGDIRHPEILKEGATTQPSGIPAMGISLVKASEHFIISYSRWIWPLVEDFHFVGLILLLGTVGILDLRILGFFKQLPVGPLQRFIPWGIAGLVINVLTGFLFFVGMPYFYVFNWIFQLKILAVALAAANLLFFHSTGIFSRWAELGAGDDAPGSAKLVAASSLVLWIAVVIIGRYIPLGEFLGEISLLGPR